MSSEQLKDIIERLIYVAGAVIAIWKFFDYLAHRDKERSLGASKVLELIEEDRGIRQEFQELKKREDLQDDKIENLERHYDSLINRFLDFLKK